MNDASKNRATEEHVKAFCAVAQAKVDAGYTGYQHVKAPRVKYEIGKVYARVFTQGEPPADTSRSAYAFISLADGQVWKSASWKAPAKNFPRCSVHDLAAAAKACGMSGVS